jgi:hypothetical protein
VVVVVGLTVVDPVSDVEVKEPGVISTLETLQVTL